MDNFKELFEIKNDNNLLHELDAVALNYYHKILKDGIDNLENCKYFLLCLDRLYQNGLLSPLRDEEYDAALELYLDAGGEMIRGDMSSGDKAVHVYPNLKGTIKKVHFITEKDRIAESKVKAHKSLEPWLRGIYDLIKDSPRDKTIELGFFTKFDGLSVILEIENSRVKSAITRGDKDLGTGQNKTNIFKNRNFKEACRKLGVDRFGLKCEALVSKDAYKEYNKLFGDNKLIDERSAATAILNSDNPSDKELSYLTLMPLMLEVNGKEIPYPLMSNKEIGYEVFPWADEIAIRGCLSVDLEDLSNSLEMIKETITWMTGVVREIEYPVDGIVIRVMDEDIRKMLGRNEEECVNNWEKAYKFKPIAAKSKIVDIEQEIGLLGKVSFTAKVEPVKIKNKTIKSISLGSFPRFLSLNLAVGDEVNIHYDIIPYLTVDETCKRSGNKPIDPIVYCPYCGEQLGYNPELSCVNPNCKSRVIGKIYNFCSRLGMYGIGEETIATLYNHNFLTKISDLYRLKDHKSEIKQIDRFGDKYIKNMLESIDSVKSIDASTFLGALGINKVGKRVFDKVLNEIKYEDLFKDNLYEKLCNIKGIGNSLATAIVEGLSINKDEIETLSSYLKIKTAKKESFKVVFSGIRNKAFEKFLADRGIETMDGINKDCKMLIVKDENSTSSKTKFAVKHDITIIPISRAYTLFGYVEG